MKIFLILLILISTNVLAAARMEINFSSDKVKQGSLQKSLIKLDETSAQVIELQKLKGQTLGETLYIYSVSPLLRKDGGSTFEAEATVIFVKVPEQNKLGYKTPQTDIEVTWNQVEVIPTEAPQELLFGTFTIPSKMKLLTWFLLLSAVVVLVIAGIKGRKLLLNKKALKIRKLNAKAEILSAKEFSDVVHLWQKKHSLFREFPHIEEPFKDLEKVLYKHQFKPFQTETEKIEVMNAYREFTNRIEGGFNGI